MKGRGRWRILILGSSFRVHSPSALLSSPRRGTTSSPPLREGGTTLISPGTGETRMPKNPCQHQPHSQGTSTAPPNQPQSTTHPTPRACARGLATDASEHARSASPKTRERNTTETERAITTGQDTTTLYTIAERNLEPTEENKRRITHRKRIENGNNKLQRSPRQSTSSARQKQHTTNSTHNKPNTRKTRHTSNPTHDRLNTQHARPTTETRRHPPDTDNSTTHTTAHKDQCYPEQDHGENTGPATHTNNPQRGDR